ncbi:DUF421 domain-containing protein [Arthrobacter livingstonensis]|uniref:DUF421 domain-containing protein n=1 Tax=Arthrobacter livingstonensis TaxID=670078 RepID=A0A2V5L7W8_9MICC|nr:YetF domain-containing protein [Arthrobacter livingstonensis]PYI66424.1 DUF421 domain-containing protein [Arthrobacter livingstonensis]
MDIVIRSAVAFIILWLITRAVGPSTLGELSSFELLLFITMGDLVQQGVTQGDYSVAGAVMAVGTMALFTVGLSYANMRWPKLGKIVQGTPVVILHGGVPDLKAMRHERLGIDDLMGAARGQGFRNCSEIDMAVLEPNGKISFFAMDQQSSSGAPEEPEAG